MNPFGINYDLMNEANDGEFLTWCVVVPTKRKVFVLNTWIICTMEHGRR